MRFLLTLLTMLPSAVLTAQLAPLAPGFTTYVFGDKVNVRAGASPDAKVVAQLNGGDAVIILETSAAQYTSNGNSQPWYKIQFNKTQNGYVWGGMLSYSGEQNLDGIKFAVGIVAARQDKKDESTAEYTLEMRAFGASGALLSKTTETLTAQSGYYISAVPIFKGALGLKGYSALLVAHIGYDACGYPGYKWYALWDGQKLASLPLCTSISDGDVFYHTETYRFPEPMDEYSQGHLSGDDQIFFIEAHHEKQYIGDDEMSGWNEEGYTRARPVKMKGGKFVKPKMEK